MSFVLPLFGLAIAAALSFAAYRYGWRGALVAVGVPLTLMVWLWLALHFHWIEHTGDNENAAALFLILVWILFASLASMFGLALRKRR